MTRIKLFKKGDIDKIAKVAESFYLDRGYKDDGVV